MVITFTCQAGINAVVSGIFFDPPTTATATASLVKTDTTTEGTWIGSYGTQGYDLINSSSSLPSYATVTPTGDLSWTWAASTTDPRGLQVAGGGSRIAACWYSATSFSVDVDLTDGQAHDVAIYALDYDRKGRGEQVQISSAATGAVLDTESALELLGWRDLQWKISGTW